jgi:hypothetical protein
MMAKALGGGAASVVDSAANLMAVSKNAYAPQPETPGTWSDVDEAKSQLNEAAIAPAAANMAMTLMGGGAPAAEEGAVGIFGGRLAKTMNPMKYTQAGIMEMKGASPEEIWHETGWGRGADNKWRFEIPDQGAKASLPEDAVSDVNKDVYYPVGMEDVLHHPALYQAYPDIANLPVNWTKEAGNAGHIPIAGDESFEFSPYDSHKTLTPISLHEAQHAVQWREGFAPGDNPSNMTKYVVNTLMKQGKLPDTGLDLPLMDKLGYEAYARHAGEVEARNVMLRQPFSNIERKAIPPWETEDRKRGVQIIRPPIGNGPYQPIPPKRWQASK